MAVDFNLSPEQSSLQQAARTFAQEQLSRIHGLISKLSTPDERFNATREAYAAMSKAGFVKALIPKEYGGTDLPTLEFAIAAEELAAVDINVPTTLLATMLGLEPILLFGSPEQKRRFLPAFAEEGTDRLAAWAFTEVGGGANFDCPDPAAGVKTVARREGNEWVISGHKHHTTNGTGWSSQGPHLMSVLCRTDLKKPPNESLAVIVVPGGTPGVRIVETLDMIGHRAVSSPVLEFKEVRVPAENMIGAPGDGARIAPAVFSRTAALIGAACTGVMRAAFDHAYEFSKRDRRLGSTPVLEYQNVGYMLADIKARVEASRYLAWKACHYLDATNREGEEMAIIAKIHCSELCVQTVYDAMRLVGVDSYTSMTPLAGLMMEALCFPLYDGGNMGVRRRQMHKLFQQPGYDALAAAESRAQPRKTPPAIVPIREVRDANRFEIHESRMKGAA
jgi:alkylation response protein AidB-like acyl-CoA dehydrogenase